MAFYEPMQFHEGERLVQEKLHIMGLENPTVPALTEHAVNMLMRAPLLAMGTIDAEGRPWTSLWGGERGFSQAIGENIIGVKTPVASSLDPVVETLVGHEASGKVVQATGSGTPVSGLAIDLESRRRAKLAGHFLGGALEGIDAGEDSLLPKDVQGAQQGMLQLVVKVDQSIGNCPKYLNKKVIQPAFTNPRLISDSVPLSDAAVKLIQKSDLFFISSVHGEDDMDTNHRGGPAGFVRVVPSDSGATQFVYPEYSGNRFYQSLGNLITNPKGGFCFPDFDTGDCLYVTGTTEILFGADAAAVISRSNLAVKITVTAARFVSGVLPFRGRPGEASPYNPVVRPLHDEHIAAQADTAVSSNRAKLLEQEQLTPTISRFRFSLENAATYTAGQYVTLDCSDHLDIGYSHMREDDPRSLNDDFIRTFTVSSAPGLPPVPSRRLADDEFEITIRKVGVVTGLLFKHGLNGKKDNLEIGIKGFGGNFMVRQDTTEQTVGFVGAGVGITPLMPSLYTLKLQNLRLLWTVRVPDIGLAAYLLKEHPELAQSLTLFVTGPKSDEYDALLKEVEATQAKVEYRRMQESDVVQYKGEAKRWYVCTGNQQRTHVLKWLQGEETLYEDYNF